TADRRAHPPGAWTRPPRAARTADRRAHAPPYRRDLQAPPGQAPPEVHPTDPGCSLVPSPSVAPTVSISCVRTLFPRPSDRFVAKSRPPRWQVLHAPSVGRCRRRAVLL
uniref:Uncharacterized protein n=1 Tax=Triticum urartu TaxID=4572 RepID=A0A8R7PH16_TRIUA